LFLLGVLSPLLQEGDVLTAVVEGCGEHLLVVPLMPPGGGDLLDLHLPLMPSASLRRRKPIRGSDGAVFLDAFHFVV